jgi:hypothetical protein
MGDRVVYWSIARGAEARAAMQACVQSARAAGFWMPFHVLTDAEIEGCECYDEMGAETAPGFETFLHLKVSIQKLRSEYAVYVHPRSIFHMTPGRVLEACGRAPVHIPMEDEVTTDSAAQNLVSLLRETGVVGPIFRCRPGLIITRMNAVSYLYDHVLKFRDAALKAGWEFDGSIGWSFLAHMMVGGVDLHRSQLRPDLWGVARSDSVELAETPSIVLSRSVEFASTTDRLIKEQKASMASKEDFSASAA